MAKVMANAVRNGATEPSRYASATATGTSCARLNSMNSPPLTRSIGARRMAAMRTECFPLQRRRGA